MKRQGTREVVSERETLSLFCTHHSPPYSPALCLVRDIIYSILFSPPKQSLVCLVLDFFFVEHSPLAFAWEKWVQHVNLCKYPTYRVCGELSWCIYSISQAALYVTTVFRIIEFLKALCSSSRLFGFYTVHSFQGKSVKLFLAGGPFFFSSLDILVSTTTSFGRNFPSCP